jgi:2-hydroxy fatty acid dioxygenase
MNNAVHVVAVPMIHLTAFILLCGVSLAIPGFSFRVDLALVASAIMLTYYAALDKVFALFMTPYLGTVYAASALITRSDNDGTLRSVAVIMFIVAWLAQVFAHVVFEKNMPALTEDPINAVLIAPMFVVLEIVFSLGLGKKLKTKLAHSRRVGRAKKALGSS